MTAREAVEDCLILRESAADHSQDCLLPRGATVGTSSLRREAQLLRVRPDLKITALRGNVPTRIRAVSEGTRDGVILAAAGLNRLSLDLKGLIRLPLPQGRFVPAPGQGALGIETRVDIPADLQMALDPIHDINSCRETRVERRILQGLHGGCTLPLGVRCELKGGELRVRAFLGLLKDIKGTGPREWLGFLDFEIQSSDEEGVIASVVDHFIREASRVGAKIR